jgi:4-hydroxybenzoate polyprenyltransferase
MVEIDRRRPPRRPRERAMSRPDRVALWAVLLCLLLLVVAATSAHAAVAVAHHAAAVLAR